MNTTLLLLTIVSTLVAAAATTVAWRAARENSRRAAARIAVLAEAIQGPGVVSAMPPRDLRRPMVAAACAVPVLLISLLVWLARPAPTVREQPADLPLQLVALSHALTADGLLVTGRIRNPDSGLRRQDITVVVQAYDPQGQLVARAQGDAGSEVLEPGRSSTFALTVPSRATAATFKVSFRQRDVVVPHVDERVAPDTASVRGQP